jgi:hypothetical protein
MSALGITQLATLEGLDLDTTLDELMLVAHSRVIGTSNGRRDRVHMMCSTVAYMASLPYATAAGVLLPLAPDLDVQLSTGDTILKRNGWTPAFLDLSWNEAEVAQRVYAQLPTQIVDEFAPVELRSVFAVLAALGPAETHDRLVNGLRAYALRAATAGPRIGEPVGGGTLSVRYTTVRRFMKVLCDLHSEGYAAPAGSAADVALKKWTSVPSSIDARALSHAENGGAVPRYPPSEELLRLALARLSDLLKLRYRTNGNLRDRTTFKCFRDFALVGLVCATGGREGAFFLRPDGPVRVRDYDPAHKFAGTEYVGPALRICVAKKGSGKTQKANGYKTQWLALPPPVAQAMETYLDIIGTRELPDAPLWIKQWADRKRTIPDLDNPLDVRAFDYIVSKAFDADVLRGGYRFSPHNIRHTVEPTSEAVGTQWLRGELCLPAGFPKPTDTEVTALGGQTVADALTSHSFRGHDPNGYKHREANRERFALVGAFGMWERLTGDLGAVKGPDLERRMRADQRYAEFEAELTGSAARLSALSDETRRTIRQMAGAAGSGPSAHVLQARKWELEHDYLLETARKSSMEIHLVAARAELTAAYAARVPLPSNWLPEREPDVPIRLDEAAVRTHGSLQNLYWQIEQGRLPFVKCGRRYRVTISGLRSAGLLDAGGEPLPDEEHPDVSPHLDAAASTDIDDVPVGARVTLAVAARIFMKSDAAMKRWAVGKMPLRPGDPRNPWQPNSDPTQPPECIEGGFATRSKQVVVTPALALWLRRNPLIRERFALALAGRL